MKKKIIAAALLAISLVSFPSLAQQPTQANPTCAEAQCNNKARCAVEKCDVFEGLNLTEQQKTQLNELRQQRAAKAKAEGEKVRKDRKQARQDYLNNVKAILTPEQYVSFLEISFLNNNGGHNKTAKMNKDGKRDGKRDGKQHNGNRQGDKQQKTEKR